MQKKLISLAFLSLFLIFNELTYSQEQIPTEVFGSPPLISTVKISPNGEKIAMYATLQNGESAILIRDLTKNKPLQPIATSDNKTLKLLGFSWFSDDIILARAWLASDFYGTKLDNTRLLRVNVDGTGFEPLFKRRHFKDLPWQPPQQTGIIDWLEEDKDHILVQVPMSNIRSPDVVKVNVKKNTIKIVKKGVAGTRSWMTDEYVEVRIGRTYDRDRSAGTITFKDSGSTKWRTVWKFKTLG